MFNSHHILKVRDTVMKFTEHRVRSLVCMKLSTEVSNDVGQCVMEIKDIVGPWLAYVRILCSFTFDGGCHKLIYMNKTNVQPLHNDM